MATTAGLDETYKGLGDTAQHLYRCLGVLPVDTVDPDMIAATCRLEREAAEGLLDVLADKQMLEPFPAAGPARYRLPGAVRGHAQLLARQHDAQPALTRAVRRLARWMLGAAAVAQVRLTPAQAALQQKNPPAPPDRLPFRDDAGAMAWLESYQGSLLGIVRLAYQNGWDELAWRLVDAWWPLFLRRQPYALWVEAHRIGLDSARRADDPDAVRQMLLSGAIGLRATDRLDQAVAWTTAALARARTAGATRDEGQARHELGSCHLAAGRPSEAELHLNAAIACWEQCDYPRGIALATIILGQIALDTDPRRAQEMFANAHGMLVAAHDPYDAARALALYGHARVQTGDVTTGIAEMKEAALMFRAADSTRWLARVLDMLGSAHQDLDPRSARAYYRQAADLYDLTSPVDAARLRQLAPPL